MKRYRHLKKIAVLWNKSSRSIVPDDVAMVYGDDAEQSYRESGYKIYILSTQKEGKR